MDVTGLSDAEISKKVEELWLIFTNCATQLDGINGQVTREDIEDIVKQSAKRLKDEETKIEEMEEKPGQKII